MDRTYASDRRRAVTTGACPAPRRLQWRNNRSACCAPATEPWRDGRQPASRCRNEGARSTLMNRTRMTLSSIVAAALVLNACGGGSEGDGALADATTSMTVPKETTAPTPSTTRPPTSGATTTITEAASEWREKVTAACDGAGPLLVAIQPNDGTAASIAAEAVATKAVFEGASLTSIDFPSDVQPAFDRIAT